MNIRKKRKEITDKSNRIHQADVNFRKFVSSEVYHMIDMRDSDDEEGLAKYKGSHSAQGIQNEFEDSQDDEREGQEFAEQQEMAEHQYDQQHEQYGYEEEPVEDNEEDEDEEEEAYIRQANQSGSHKIDANRQADNSSKSGNSENFISQ